MSSSHMRTMFVVSVRHDFGVGFTITTKSTKPQLICSL